MVVAGGRTAYHPDIGRPRENDVANQLPISADLWDRIPSDVQAALTAAFASAAGGVTTTRTYDARGRLVAMRDQPGTVQSMFYYDAGDGDGHPPTETDGPSVPPDEPFIADG